MKKNIKKTIAVVLTLIMILSGVSVMASAATKDNVRQYGTEGGYLAIGDSISRGCGATGFHYDVDTGEYLPDGEGQYGRYEIRNVDGCVPYQIAQAVGCTAPVDMADQNATYWPFTYPGMTTAVTLDLLGVDDNFTDTKLNYAYYADMMEYFGWDGAFDGVREGDSYEEVVASRGGAGKCGNIMELIPRADLITVQLGMCDIFYRAYRVVSNGGMLADGLSFDLSSPEAIVKLVETAISEMWFGFEYWKLNYPTLIEKLMEMNPDADIVMIGSFNLVNQLTITDEIFIPIGNVISVITDRMNQLYQEWAKKYGIRYADISSTETQATENDWSIMGDFKDHTFTGTHPTQTGYDYIVRQVLATLPGGEEVDNGKNIVVDLGRFDKVDYVLVDGEMVKDYTMDGFVLTIPYTSRYAKNLTIGVKGDDGNLMVQTYSLTWNYQTERYESHRIYGTNDAAKPVRPFLEKIKDFFQKIIDWFKGLFN